MLDYVNIWLGKSPRPLAPRIHCKSGLTLSVQASEWRYCAPRDDTGPWHRVEVGYPSRTLRTLSRWRDGRDSPVYAYVPVERVNAIIARNGGIDWDAPAS